MRILLDTNIFIYREDDHVLSEDLKQLLSVLYKLKVELLIHPLSQSEITKDKDVARREIILSKIGSYPTLEMPPDPVKDNSYLATVGSTEDEHELIDNHILYAIYKDAVDFLITEDKGIHKKAAKLSVDNRVLLITEALTFLSGHLQKDSFTTPPALKIDYVYNLNINDPFFNSLKDDYPEFGDWFSSVSKEGRRCLVYYNDDKSIGALMVYKLEEEPIDITPPLPKKRRVKISTLRVAQMGYKIGELFIKQSVDIAIQNDISEIYLTHFILPEDRLVELITEFGFYKVGINQRQEGIFIKNLLPEKKELLVFTPFEITTRFYPCYYDGKDVNKFIIPIRPQYHSRLFTNYKGRQISLSEYAGNFIVEGNTIRKAYICNSRIKKVKRGDVILFYISKRKQLTSIGVVEAIYSGINDVNDIVKLVGKRTVYSLNEIKFIARQSTLVILFWQYLHLNSPLSLAQLIKLGVLRCAPRSILSIPEAAYRKIKKAGAIDERFTIN